MSKAAKSAKKPKLQTFERSAQASARIKEMDEFGRNLTPEKAKEFLLRVGIITPSGKLSSKYR